MTLSTRYPNLEPFELIYPDSDGKPMSESDPTRDYLIYGVEALDLYFRDRPDVYVSGNLFIYYQQGVPDAVISPDVFVVFGVEKKKRRSYKTWEESGKVPSFVMEVTSKTTQNEDNDSKRQKYQQLGVMEYIRYDPTGDYLQPSLQGLRLVDGRYYEIPTTSIEGDRYLIYSETLGLELHLVDAGLRFYDPSTQQRLLSGLEREQARQQAEQARQQAEQARQQAEQALFDAIPRLAALGLGAEQIAATLGLTIATVTARMEQSG